MRLKRRRLDFSGGVSPGGVSPGGPAGFLDLGPPGEETTAGDVPVVLVHGFAGDALTWQFILPHLARRRRVVAIDLPGHGGSTQDVGDGTLEGLADWLWRALDALGLSRVHLVGHSMGAKTALLASLAQPERAASLVLLSCAGIAPDVDAGLLRQTLNARTTDEAAACVGALFAGPTPLLDAMSKALLARVAGPVSTAPLHAVLDAAFSRPDHWLKVDWRRVPDRLLVVWGDADRLIPLPDAAFLPSPDRVRVLAGVGHLPHLESPGAVNTLLDEFLSVD